ncbi:MAG: 1-deoxy-D-xylulose-5-phosphate reductoisomerase [Clostridia bacterium]|nr:1-deoxy-D-xylulose-5-phosphate reductoisomerase [Clostridia bacterium]
MKSIAVFGSTGSIGTQALSVAGFHKDEFSVKVIAANRNVDLVEKQIDEFAPEYVGIYDESAAAQLKKRRPNCKIVSGNEVNALCALPVIDTVVNGVSGFAGLFPLLSALEAGKTVALANKESIVCAHTIVNAALERHGGRILPVDSEQSALFQCLAAGRREDVKSLILTASGGMFRDFTAQQLERVTPEMALYHPTWSMGRKITIDSSSLFNKGLELMEAGWLFNFSPDEIRIFIHPQSIVHSMVEYKDGSVIAQLAKPDMRLAIQYALTYPARIPSQLGGVSPALLSGLTFAEPDTERFPAISLAYEAFREANSLPVAYNSGNEAAVERFIGGELRFTEIASCVEYAMARISRVKVCSAEDVLALDREARRLAGEYSPRRST